MPYLDDAMALINSRGGALIRLDDEKAKIYKRCPSNISPDVIHRRVQEMLSLPHAVRIEDKGAYLFVLRDGAGEWSPYGMLTFHACAEGLAVHYTGCDLSMIPGNENPIDRLPYMSRGLGELEEFIGYFTTD